MPHIQYFLQRIAVPVNENRTERCWEQVDEFVFKNWKFAVDEKDQPRYTGNRFTTEGGQIFIAQESDLVAKDLVHIAKLSGAHHNDLQSPVPGGFCKKPEYVKIVKPKGISIRQVGFRTFKAKPTDIPPRSPAAAFASDSREEE